MVTLGNRNVVRRIPIIMVLAWKDAAEGPDVFNGTEQLNCTDPVYNFMSKFKIGKVRGV